MRQTFPRSGTAGKLELGRRVADRLYPLALGIGVLISAGLPTTYYTLKSIDLTHAATVYAQELSVKLQDLWKYPDNVQRYHEIRHAVLRGNDVTSIRIVDEAGRPITDYEHRTAEANAWWNRFAPRGSAPIILNNRIVGTVHVGVPLGSLLGVTLALLLLSTTTGTVLAGLAYGFPVKVVTGMEAQLQDLITAEQRSNRELAHTARENARHFQEAEQRRRHAEALRESEKLRAVGEMAGGVAHDFNNLLAAILGRAQLLLVRLAEGEVAPDAVRRSLSIIERSALDGAETVRRLLEFTRAKPQLKEAEAVGVNDLLASVVAASEPRWKDEAEARGAHIEVVEEFGRVLAVVGDAAELRELLLNLVFNAIDAMPGGGTLTLSSWAEESAVCLAVTDTGVGIPEEVRSRIFDPFFTTKGPQSSGLGLSVSYGIIRRHGGEIRVESRAGQGTRFTVRLPFREAPPPQVEDVASEPAGPGLRVLVIDDEAGVREMLRDLLEALGQEVWEAGSGPEGLELLERQPMDLVCTDLGLPGMKGWEVAERVKARWPRLKVALITGWGVRVAPAELEAHGVDLLIAKPFQMKEILDALSALSQSTGGTPSDTDNSRRASSGLSTNCSRGLPK